MLQGLLGALWYSFGLRCVQPCDHACAIVPEQLCYYQAEQSSGNTAAACPLASLSLANLPGKSCEPGLRHPSQPVRIYHVDHVGVPPLRGVRWPGAPVGISSTLLGFTGCCWWQKPLAAALKGWQSCRRAQATLRSRSLLCFAA